MWRQKENIGEGWSRQSLELDELTAQGDKPKISSDPKHISAELDY